MCAAEGVARAERCSGQSQARGGGCTGVVGDVEGIAVPAAEVTQLNRTQIYGCTELEQYELEIVSSRAILAVVNLVVRGRAIYSPGRVDGLAGPNPAPPYAPRSPAVNAAFVKALAEPTL